VAAEGLTGFEATIARATEGFVGRKWLDREVDAFLRNKGRYADGASFLLIVGEPGIGKTAYAAHLARKHGWIHYFCSRLHPGLLDPGHFARNLGSQLFKRFGSDYARVLASQQHVDITAQQRVGTIEVGGQAVNVYIENLVASDPHELFARLVADPLAALLSERPDETVGLVIDGLDEARTYRGRVTILDLVAAATDLTPGVRTVATSRPDRQMQRLLAGAVVLDLKNFTHDLEHDALGYIGERLRAPAVRNQLKQAGGDTAELTRTIAERGKGNFLYLRLLLASGAPPLAADEVPEGLGDVYARSLDDLLVRSGLEWRSHVRPVAGILAVAQEPLTFDQVERFSGLDATSVQDALAALESLLEEARDGDAPRYAYFHGSLSEVLLDRAANPSYWIDGSSFHLRIARSAVPAGGTWSDVDWHEADNYLLEHVAGHLFLAGRGGFEDLQALVSPGFRAAKNRRFLSDESFLLDLETAIEAAEQDGLAGLPRVLALSLGSAMLHARLTATPVGALVALARLGNESEALARLASVRPMAAVSGLIAVARQRHAAGRRNEARSLLEQAAHRAVSQPDDDSRRESIGELLTALPLEGDPLSLDSVLEPLLFAIRELPEAAMKIWPLAQALTCRAKAGDLGGARELAVEAFAILGEVEQGERFMAVAQLAQASELLDHEQTAGLWDDALAELRAMPAAAANRTEWLEVFGALGLVDEAIEFARTLMTVEFAAIPKHFNSGEALDRVAELAPGIEDDGDRLSLQAGLAARRSELGDSERALAELTALEPELASHGVGLVPRIRIRIEAAERLGPNDRQRAQALLEQPLAIMEELARERAERGHLHLLDDPIEDALLRLAEAAAKVGDPRWGRSTVERTLGVLLAAEPLSMLVFVEPLLWRAREQASIAAVFVQLGAVQRAKELFTQAAADARKIGAEAEQAEALGIVAERLLAVPDPPWVESAVRSLLSAPGMLPGIGEAALYLALARAGAIEALAPARAIIGRHLANPDYPSAEVLGEIAEFAETVDPAEALELATVAANAAWATGDNELRGRLLRSMMLFRLSAGAGTDAGLEELEVPQRGLAYAALATFLRERGNQPAAISALEQAIQGEADAAALLAAIPPDAPAQTIDRFLRKVRERIGEAFSKTSDHQRRTSLSDGLAAEKAISARAAAERAQASKTALLALAGGMRAEQRTEAIIALIGGLERDSAAAPLVAELARLAVKSGRDQHLGDAIDWLLNAAAWASSLAHLAEVAGWTRSSPEFEHHARDIGAAAFQACGDVAAAFAEAGDEGNAQRLAARVRAGDGKAYVMGRLAAVLHEQGRREDAAEYVEAALAHLLTEPNAFWPDAFMEVVAGLARSGREAHALGLTESVADATIHNDMIDATARAFVAVEPEHAITVLDHLAKFDPMSLHASFPHAHSALQEAIDVMAKRGDVERAADLLQRFGDDPWAIPTRPWALSALSDALTELASSDPKRAAAISYQLLANVRTSQSEVLEYAKSLIPVLRARADLPASAWRELQAVPTWAASASL
jgi:hypothetical protein